MLKCKHNNKIVAPAAKRREKGKSMTQKFFLYARKSTDVEDKQILSIEAQLTELRALAKQENLEIVAEFVEKQSAKIPGRPIFNQMLERIEKIGSNEANGILAWHPLCQP